MKNQTFSTKQNQTSISDFRSISNELDKLHRLSKKEVKIAGEVAARAFFDDYVFSQFLPDIVKRKKYSHHIWDYITRFSVIYGECYAPSPNVEGVAGWVYYKKYRVSSIKMIRSGVFNIIFRTSGIKLRLMMRYNDLVDKIHRVHANFPHLYLRLLAVDPKHQGKGYASKLLRPMLARIDEEQLPCYVDTQKEENVYMYQHFGFELVEAKTLDGTDLRTWHLLREPM